MVLDRLGIRRTLSVLAVLPFVLLATLAWVVVDDTNDRAEAAEERRIAAQRVVALGRVRSVLLAELAIYEIWLNEATRGTDAISGPQSGMLEVGLRSSVDAAHRDVRTEPLGQELLHDLDQLYADLVALRVRRATGDTTIGERLTELQDRTSALRDPTAWDTLMSADETDVALLHYSDFGDSLVVEATLGTGVLTIGLLDDQALRRYEQQVASTDARLGLLLRDLGARGDELADLLRESVFTDLRERVRELPREGAPQPISAATGLTIATGAMADTEAVVDFVEILSSEVIADAEADRSNALTRRTVTVVALVGTLAATAIVVLVIGRRLTRRVSRLADVASRVSNGELDLEPIGDRGTDGVSLLARAMDDMIGTLSGVQRQLAALAEGNDDDTVFDVEIPGSVGASLRSTVGRVKAHTDRLQEEADTDALTGLTNRRAFERAVRGTPDLATLVVVDLDGFKDVNDRLGHTAGDEVLVAVGQRLRGVVRSDDLIARLGGDEFMLAIHDDAVAADIGDRVTATLRQPVRTTAGPVWIAASVGVAWPRPNECFEDVVRRADQAMYERKRAARAAGYETVAPN